MMEQTIAPSANVYTRSAYFVHHCLCLPPLKFIHAAGFAIPEVPVPQDLKAIMEMIGEAAPAAPVQT
jgi:hypothetical protein